MSASTAITRPVAIVPGDRLELARADLLALVAAHLAIGAIRVVEVGLARDVTSFAVLLREPSAVLEVFDPILRRPARASAVLGGVVVCAELHHAALTPRQTPNAAFLALLPQGEGTND